MDETNIIHKRIEKGLSEIRHLQKTLVLLGLPEYWPDGKSDGLAPTLEVANKVDEGGSTSVRGSIADQIRSAGKPLGVEELDVVLKLGALAHETDKRIRRRKISQALYASKDVLKAVPGNGGRHGYKYGLKEWFDGDKLRKEYNKK